MAACDRYAGRSIGRRPNLGLLLLLGTAVFAGCDGGIAVPATAPVNGVVKYKGKPIQGIRVTFHPQDETLKAGFVPSGETGPDGKFRLSTGAPHNGAPPGSYVVTFEKLVIGSPAATGYVETEVDALRGKYSDPAQSKWTVNIASGENSLPPFELE